MVFTIEPGVACYAIGKVSWDAGTVDGVVLHQVKQLLVFDSEDVVCDPSFPESAGLWTHYALGGFFGFLRGGRWVLLIHRDQVTVG